jgi:hypothetical protein
MLWCVVRLLRNENVDLVINKHEHLVAYIYSIINVLVRIVSLIFPEIRGN